MFLNWILFQTDLISSRKEFLTFLLVAECLISSEAQSVFLRYNWGNSIRGYRCEITEGRFIDGPDSWLIPSHVAGKNNHDVTEIFTGWVYASNVNFTTIPAVFFDLFPSLDDLTLSYVGLASMMQGQLKDLKSFSSRQGNLETLSSNIFGLSF